MDVKRSRRNSGKQAKTDSKTEGLVVSHLGKSLAVETADGDIVLCHTRRRLGLMTVGDRVLWKPTEGNLGIIVKLLPRVSLLSRPSRNNKSRPVAANLDQVLVVFSPRPRCDLLLVDQYLVNCENHSLNALLVHNKIDLDIKDEQLDSALDHYHRIGYEVLSISAKSKTGLSQFKHALRNHTSILVGQSGVGKSSLTNAVLPDKNLKIGKLSDSSHHGKHTTTTATLYNLPYGGSLIDSPGVSVFGLSKISAAKLAYGFREFQAYIPHCKFNDCRHLEDKGCAVVAAIGHGKIDARRYDRFKKLRRKLIENAE